MGYSVDLFFLACHHSQSCSTSYVNTPQSRMLHLSSKQLPLNAPSGAEMGAVRLLVKDQHIWYVPYSMWWFYCVWFIVIALSVFVNYNMHLPIFFRVASLALAWSYNYHSASKVTLNDMGKIERYSKTTHHSKALIIYISYKNIGLDTIGHLSFN